MNKPSLTFAVFILTFGAYQTVIADQNARIEQCSGPYNAGNSSWTNCVGKLTFSNGTKYVGEFKDGNLNGQVTVTFANGGKYVGELKDGKQSGQGTATSANGEKYVGEFKNGSYVRNK